MGKRGGVGGMRDVEKQSREKARLGITGRGGGRGGGGDVVV